MASPNKLVIGNLYDMKQQNRMHGCAHQQCAATKDGDVTLLRLTPEHNADAPYIVDWESSNNPKVRQIQEQTQQKPLSVYVKRRPNTAWLTHLIAAWLAHVSPSLPRSAKIEGGYGDNNHRPDNFCYGRCEKLVTHLSGQCLSC